MILNENIKKTRNFSRKFSFFKKNSQNLCQKNDGFRKFWTVFDFWPKNPPFLFFQMIVYFVFLRKKICKQVWTVWGKFIFLVSVPVCTLKFQKCPIPKILIGLTFYRFLSLRFFPSFNLITQQFTTQKKYKGTSIILKSYPKSVFFYGYPGLG